MLFRSQLTAKALCTIAILDKGMFHSQFKSEGYVNGKTLKDYVERYTVDNGRTKENKAGGKLVNGKGRAIHA